LGISDPVLKDPGRIEMYTLTNPNADEGDAGPKSNAPRMVTVPRFNFVVQFAWQPTPPSQRHAKQQQQSPVANAPTGPR
jgi:hypothetical protein